MGDLSTREQIRADVIERLARAEFEKDRELIVISNRPPWDEASEAERAEYRGIVAHLADALGDLLPTGIEWGVYLDGMAPPNPFRTASESTARSLLDTQDDHVVRKYTHDWIEVTE